MVSFYNVPDTIIIWKHEFAFSDIRCLLQELPLTVIISENSSVLRAIGNYLRDGRDHASDGHVSNAVNAVTARQPLHQIQRGMLT